MKTFTDLQAHRYTVPITVGSIRRVRAACDVDLLQMTEDKGALARRLAADAILLVDVLWVLCQNEAENWDVTAEQFGESFDGQVLEDASVALLENLIDFFPPDKRRVLRAALVKVQQEQPAMVDRIVEDIQNHDLQEIESRLRRTLKQRPKASVK